MTAYLQELFSLVYYKRSQGKIARHATFYALALIVACCAWSLHVSMETSDSPSIQRSAWLASVAVFVLGCWAAFRLVQVPRFADFLISVESEMNKVSWPSRGELWKASVVVILTIFVLAAVLFMYDFIWQRLLGLVLGN